jgi:hypothetical protein
MIRGRTAVRSSATTAFMGSRHKAGNDDQEEDD